MSKSHFINGLWVQGKGLEFTSIDPASQKVVWRGFEATEAEVERAVEVARNAFKGWSCLGIDGRIKYLEKFKGLLQTHQKDLCEIISKETGKVLWETFGEVTSMINKLSVSIEAYLVRCPEMLKKQPLGTLTVRHRPHGVMVVFGPYNFPGHTPNGQIIPALLAGNTIIYKPSEMTPLVAESIMKLWEESGLPPGVINLLQGGKDTGQKLLEHPHPDGFLFTGSWKTGKHFSEQLKKAPHKILALEMGGNNPLVVGSISDFKAAAYQTIQSAFITSGQRCTCARRLIVPIGEIGDQFISTFIEMASKIQVGAYLDEPQPFMGPVISSSVAKNLVEVQKKLIESGAKSLLSLELLSRGSAFVSPGIIDVTHVDKRSDDEIFGPLLQVIRVSNFNEAIDEANHTEYGLSAGLFSDNPAEYHAFHDKIRAGIINWNVPLTGLSGIAPFGGIGHSGNHRPAGYYSADFCAYPVASVENETLKMPEILSPGIAF